MRSNPIQFAVVREDPEIERTIVDLARARRILLVASGGCTAFCLRAWFPRLELSLVDPNAAQLDLVRRKIAALGDPALDPRARTGRSLYGIGQDLPDSLNQCGNFESLFRQWRGFLHEFVAPKEEIEGHFATGASDPRRITGWFENRYWPVAFELFFSDSLLATMFTSAATQNAERGSYPRYFRERVELGLRRPDAATNYFLHHLLLGAYRDDPSCWPQYLRVRTRLDGIELRSSRLEDLDDFAAFDVIALSNVMDWMDDDAVARLAATIVATARRGARVVWRQLNNAADHERRFTGVFDFDRPLARRLLDADRSLFYSSLHLGTRR